MFWELKAIFGPEKDEWWIRGSKTPKPPEMPLKQGKMSQHHSWPRYMDWPQIGPKSAIKQGKERQKDKWYLFPAPTCTRGGGVPCMTERQFWGKTLLASGRTFKAGGTCQSPMKPHRSHTLQKSIEAKLGGNFGPEENRRRTNVQQLTCNIDLSRSFYYFFFSFVLLELKPFVLKGKVLGENF